MKDGLPELDDVCFESCPQKGLASYYELSALWGRDDGAGKTMVGNPVWQVGACCEGHAIVIGWKVFSAKCPSQLLVDGQPVHIVGMVCEELHGERRLMAMAKCIALASKNSNNPPQ